MDLTVFPIRGLGQITWCSEIYSIHLVHGLVLKHPPPILERWQSIIFIHLCSYLQFIGKYSTSLAHGQIHSLLRSWINTLLLGWWITPLLYLMDKCNPLWLKGLIHCFLAKRKYTPFLPDGLIHPFFSWWTNTLLYWLMDRYIPPSLMGKFTPLADGQVHLTLAYG